MAYYQDKTEFSCIEAFRTALIKLNPDVAARCTQTGTLLQTLGEVCALIGIPVDLNLQHAQLIEFIWDLVEVLHRRSTIMLVSGTGSAEPIAETVLALQDDLLSEVMQEFATGIIVTQDDIAVAPAADEEVKVQQKLVDEFGRTLH